MMRFRFLSLMLLLAVVALLAIGCGGGSREPRRYYSRGFSVEISGAETLNFSGGAEPEANEPRAYWQPSITVGEVDYRRVVRFEDPNSGLTVELLGITYRSSDFAPELASDGRAFAARVLTKDGKVYGSNVDGFMRVDNVSFSSFSGDGGSVSIDNIKAVVEFTAQAANGDKVDVGITIDDLPINIEER